MKDNTLIDSLNLINCSIFFIDNETLHIDIIDCFTELKFDIDADTNANIVYQSKLFKFWVISNFISKQNNTQVVDCMLNILRSFDTDFKNLNKDYLDEIFSFYYEIEKHLLNKNSNIPIHWSKMSLLFVE